MENNNEIELVSNFALSLAENVKKFSLSEEQEVNIIKNCSEVVVLFKKMTNKLVFPLLWLDEKRDVIVCTLNSTPYAVQIDFEKSLNNSFKINFFGIDSISEVAQDSAKVPGIRKDISVGIDHFMNRPDVATKDRKHLVN